MGIFTEVKRAMIIHNQKRHGFEDGKAGKQPSFIRSSLMAAGGETELQEAYEEAFRQGQQTRRNEELSK